jgi:DMSO/TMAO reductase YedYZ heme-binding membrane subunit
VFLAVHLFALWIDNYVAFGGRELFIPFASNYRPATIALGPFGAGRMPVLWGVVGMYLLIAIQVTSWMMRNLPRRLWHRVHLLSFPLFIVATLHGFTAGADNANLLVQWVALTGGLFVFFLVVFRLLAPRRARASGRARIEPAVAA